MLVATEAVKVEEKVLEGEVREAVVATGLEAVAKAAVVVKDSVIVVEAAMVRDYVVMVEAAEMRGGNNICSSGC